MTSGNWKKQLGTLQSVLAAWAHYTNEWDRDVNWPRDNAADYRLYFQQMGAGGEPDIELEQYASVSDKQEWTTLEGFFSPAGVPLKGRDDGAPDLLWPLLTLSLRVCNDELEIMVRVGVYFMDEYGSVNAYGWRFDSADSGTEGSANLFHHYAHVQQISGWEIGRQVFVPPNWPEAANGSEKDNVQLPMRMLETRPAFPLACTSPAGLLAAVVVSLYGGRRAAQVLQSVALSTHIEVERVMAGQRIVDLLEPAAKGG